MPCESKRYSKPGSRSQELKWAWIWFKKLSLHHGWQADAGQRFTDQDAVGFLRSYRDQGTPAWKRMRILEGLMVFRSEVQQQPVDDLRAMQRRLRDFVRVEKMRKDGVQDMDDVHRPINPKEADAIQAFRRAMRSTGLALGTERAYVKKAAGVYERASFDLSGRL